MPRPHRSRRPDMGTDEPAAARSDDPAGGREERDLLLRFVQARTDARAAERDRWVAEGLLQQARAHIARTQPLLRAMRTLLESVQSSKFWKARNAWFSLKKRVGLNPYGALPFWLPDIEDSAEGLERDPAYERWLVAHRIRPSDVQRIREVVPFLQIRPVFSVIMPVYETPERYLREAIESVIAQGYANWELCIADDASPAPHVRAVLEEYARADERIKLVFRRGERPHRRERAIARSRSRPATSSPCSITTTCSRRTRCSRTRCVVNARPDVDVIYSDEDKIDEQGFRRSPVLQAGLVARVAASRATTSRTSACTAARWSKRSAASGSDSRAVRTTISCCGSPSARTASRTFRAFCTTGAVHGDRRRRSRDQKEYARDAAAARARRSARAPRRAGARQRDDVRPASTRCAMRSRAPGRVSIIVPTRDHGEDVDLCLRSVFERSTYRGLEVILLDNGSTDAESLQVFGRWVEREPERFKLVPYDVPFNFSRINNYAVTHATRRLSAVPEQRHRGRLRPIGSRR